MYLQLLQLPYRSPNDYVLQNQLKKQGYPWEVAKAFDGACPLSPFIKPELIADIKHTEFSLMVNGEPRQHGFTHDMITPVYELIAYISQIFTLQAGDIVLTGTPEGVAALQRGDKLLLSVVGQVFDPSTRRTGCANPAPSSSAGDGLRR